VGQWIAERDAAEVIAAFEKAQAACAPVYDIRDVFTDAQYQALDSVTTVHDDDLGALRMQNVLFRLSRSPGAIRWTGRAPGADNEAVFGGRFGYTAEQLSALHEEGAM
jgi:crotonobetainyl-CoA:carnitine CoA-transferase CaiB-like acyl-CoA transferase